MKLWYFRDKQPNFGDELNHYVWPRVFGSGFFDSNEQTLFLGIGSILFDFHPREAKKVVLGAGYAGYTDPPDVFDGSWDVVAVRGPRTAEKLGLPRQLAITDSAILIRTVERPPPAEGVKTAFMPHYQSLPRGRWRQACALAGLTFIDPTEPTDHVLAQIAGADLLITEAMHGAIVADALRTPWVATAAIQASNRDKWSDWAESLGVDLRLNPLAASSYREHRILSGRPLRGIARRLVLNPRVAAMLDRPHVEQAAASLQALAQAEPQLSREEAVSRATEQMLQAVEVVRSRYQPSA